MNFFSFSSDLNRFNLTAVFLFLLSFCLFLPFADGKTVIRVKSQVYCFVSEVIWCTYIGTFSACWMWLRGLRSCELDNLLVLSYLYFTICIIQLLFLMNFGEFLPSSPLYIFSARLCFCFPFSCELIFNLLWFWLIFPDSSYLFPEASPMLDHVSAGENQFGCPVFFVSFFLSYSSRFLISLPWFFQHFCCWSFVRAFFGFLRFLTGLLDDSWL